MAISVDGIQVANAYEMADTLNVFRRQSLTQNLEKLILFLTAEELEDEKLQAFFAAMDQAYCVGDLLFTEALAEQAIQTLEQAVAEYNAFQRKVVDWVKEVQQHRKMLIESSTRVLKYLYQLDEMSKHSQPQELFEWYKIYNNECSAMATHSSALLKAQAKAHDTPKGQHYLFHILEYAGYVFENELWFFDSKKYRNAEVADLAIEITKKIALSCCYNIPFEETFYASYSTERPEHVRYNIVLSDIEKELFPAIIDEPIGLMFESLDAMAKEMKRKWLSGKFSESALEKVDSIKKAKVGFNVSGDQIRGSLFAAGGKLAVYADSISKKKILSTEQEHHFDLDAQEIY